MPYMFLGLALVGLQPAIALQEEEEQQPAAEEEAEEKELPKDIYGGLKVRSIGPALMSGRIGDFAVDPTNHSRYFVAVCSGGVWRTDNGGVTYTPVFDGQGSYSIGCVTIDPHNTNVVWVGSGENNSQRSVSFGDGVYKSIDGGKSWKNLGLKSSEHIGMIAIDPRDSDVVYVASQGPLWRSGGERGLYKTTDGGKSWNRVLHVSDDTGINEVHLDPRNPDVLYCSAYQRRRHVWTLINGGPESAIYKSEDAGRTFRKLTSGIPGVDKGRIGMDISPADPDVVYAIVEAADGKGGFFRSADRGESWEKRSSYMSSSPQYYNEIVCDPIEVDRVYSLNTLLMVTEDGGRTFNRVPNSHRHVDDHALWIDPSDNEHLLVGCDGGIYESYDRGKNWRFKPNLPITQFYRVSTDNSTPFYYVYGGTQDNNSQGGPSQTTDREGITNDDWFITVGGDGYETQVDPSDPMVVYSLWQYGGLVRHDRRSGEIIDIKPREKPGEAPYKWNWDSPLLISPHSHTRLYFAANRLFRSDDRGNSWTAVSEDLTRGIDRNKLEVMGRIQSIDAVSRHRSTSFYGNIVSLDESPLAEGLIYVGTDDGLIQVTEDGGKNWRKIALFPGVPDNTYVSFLCASQHDANTVFAAFDNHKMGDFKPYLLKSTDRGQTWEAIAGDLPERDIVYAIRQDHVKPELLFAGTEFGCYFTLDGGEKWTKISGLPTIAVRDLEVQKRENDLVLGTFGRSFYVLDDYTPLRQIDKETLDKESHLFTIKPALRYIQRSRLGGHSQGATRYAAPNPPFGATFTYYLKEKLTTRKERRQEAEKKALQAGKPVKIPSVEDLRAEQREQTPTVVLLVRDADGNVVRRLAGSRDKGIHRASWDLRYPAATPIRAGSTEGPPPWSRLGSGPLALPGKFTVQLARQIDAEITPLGDPLEFEVVQLEQATFPAEDQAAVLAFRQKTARLQRAVEGALRVAGEANERINALRQAVMTTPGADLALLGKLQAMDDGLEALLVELRGDPTLGSIEEPSPPSISERVRTIVGGQWNVTSPPTETHRDAYRYAGEAFADVLGKLRTLIEQDLAEVEQALESAGAPWTPGRIPTWEMEDVTR
jgi:photosystem II stability/assembly factor-like uncharacterized protein